MATLLRTSRKINSWTKSVQILKSLDRRLSTEIATKTASPAPKVVASAPASTASKGGSSFFQRFSSFLAGCGVGFGVSFYYIYEELVESNEKFSKQLEGMVSKK
jgi:hypothetical protein